MTLSSLSFAQFRLFEDPVMQCLLKNISVSKWWQDKKVAPMQETAQPPYPCPWRAVSSDA